MMAHNINNIHCFVDRCCLDGMLGGRYIIVWLELTDYVCVCVCVCEKVSARFCQVASVANGSPLIMVICILWGSLTAKLHIYFSRWTIVLLSLNIGHTWDIRSWGHFLGEMIGSDKISHSFRIHWDMIPRLTVFIYSCIYGIYLIWFSEIKVSITVCCLYCMLCPNSTMCRAQLWRPPGHTLIPGDSYGWYLNRVPTAQGKLPARKTQEIKTFGKIQGKHNLYAFIPNL